MNEIPVIRIEGATLPETWENAVMAAWKSGMS